MPQTAVLSRAPGSPDVVRVRARWRLPGHWPLTVLLAGFPLWWVLGLSSLMPLLMAVPMAVQLLRRRSVSAPKGFGWWLLFLLWVILGAATLWADAPRAVPGGESARIIVFAYRLAWYLACTTVLLWITNIDRSVLRDRHVHRLLAWMFVVATAGGLLGLVAPYLEFRSALELLLPVRIRANAFVESLVHPEAADVQRFLGRAEARPKAPFAFTNTWGSSMSLTLVFFLALLPKLSRRHRIVAAAVLAVSALPIVYSLNRGLWGSLALGMAGITILQLARGHRGRFVALVAASVIGATLFLASPLGALYQERLDNQHSNDRRSQLLTATAESVTQGSPVTGFGSTRDVQGNFDSITGGATPTCPACGVPPLGTQGQLWLVLFSQGWPGLAFFLIFVVMALARSVRCRTTNETICTFVVAFFLLQLPIYDTLGMPLFIVMLAVGLAARERQLAVASPIDRLRAASRSPARGLRTALPILVALGAAGAALGANVPSVQASPGFSSRVSILIEPAPVYLDPVRDPSTDPIDTGVTARPITIDTEAALLLSERSIDRASRETGIPEDELRRSVSITAPPNSLILNLTLRATRAGTARSGVHAVARSYLEERSAFLANRRESLVSELTEKLQGLDPTDPDTQESRARLNTALAELLGSAPVPSRIVSATQAKPSRAQVEVPASSGAALGLLAGVGWLRLRLLRSRATVAPARRNKATT
ncbi:MAG TPA: hypothetical protein VFT00_07290 [Nocardioides sp.]|nr:hypothetical protein [Nocardioides sp.]